LVFTAHLSLSISRVRFKLKIDGKCTIYKNDYSPILVRFGTDCIVLNPLIGARGFEPPTPCAQGRCASQTALRPEENLHILAHWQGICSGSIVVQKLTIQWAIEEFVHDGDSIALEGFSHLVPFAAGQEIIRQRRRDLTLIRMSADIIYDQMIGMGCARKLVFSWAGNPGLGLLHRFRDAVEKAWPRPIDLEEHTHAELATAFAAGAARLPFGIMRPGPKTDLPAQLIECPFTNEKLQAVRAINPDVAVIHAQRADAEGNVQLWGIIGIQKEAALAARNVIVTVEELCEDFDSVPGGIVIPSWTISAIALAPGGAKPSYVHGYYDRDNDFYREWDSISRDRGRFQQWMDDNVMEAAPA
jgi:glutaconate CoA-transferase subunit A